MTITAGRHSAPAAAPTGRLRATLGYAVGVLLCATAWVLLVRSAIDFGGDGRDGDALGWVFLGAAAVGAVGCLLLALVLVTRALTAAGVLSDYQPRRARRG